MDSGRSRRDFRRAFPVLKFATGRATFLTCPSLIFPNPIHRQSSALKRPSKQPSGIAKPKKGSGKK